MHSSIKNVSILINLLKQYHIQNIVLSPGGSDIPIIHSMETDSFFTCYSAVDERNAAYFAMGLSQEKNVPVACICTSGTAVCNFLPGVTEAYYQNVPLVVITADKNPYFQGQLETQKIEQTNIFKDVIKKSVNLPVIQSLDDEWLCNRLINEALLEINHHSNGPVHINIPVIGDTGSYINKETTMERIIHRTYEPIRVDVWKEFIKRLKQKQKIMIVVGQNIKFSEKCQKYMTEFFRKYNCMFAVEHLSNLDCEGKIYTYPISEMGGLNDKLLPDLILSIGNNLAAYNLKPFLRRNYKSLENWLIDPAGQVRDAYKSLTEILECEVETFFKYMVEYCENDEYNNMQYYSLWKKMSTAIEIPELTFSNMYVAKKLSENIPNNSILHLAILNSTRVMQFFPLNKNIRTYSNVGALGIDGCLATFAGQAAATKGKAFLLIGDLSFFYGMNGAAFRSINNNVRIILLNNKGGSEFHFFMGKERIPTINEFICAEHSHTAEGWIKSLGYDYYKCDNKEEFDEAIKISSQDSSNPIFIEVFTDMEEDANKLNSLYSQNKYKLSNEIGGLTGIKGKVASKLSKKQKETIKSFINKIKK